MKFARAWLCVVSSAAALLLSGAVAAAQTYPAKPVKLLVPYAPGGATDIIARVLSDRLRQALGATFVVENKPGAFGILAIEEMVRARPDGYTLMIGNVSTNAVTPVLYPAKMSINYERDVVAVARLVDIPNLFVATTVNFPPRTMAEFIDYAKRNPGKVRYGSVGIGSFPHFDTVLLAKRAGLEIVHIPVKAGAGGLLNDLVNGDIQVSLINPATAASMIKSGQLRPLAAVANERLANFPDVPTLAETGLPGIGTLAWQAMFARAGTPPDVIAILSRNIVSILNDETVRQTLAKYDMRVATTNSPEEAARWLNGELQHWHKVVTETQIDLTD